MEELLANTAVEEAGAQGEAAAEDAAVAMPKSTMDSGA